MNILIAGGAGYIGSIAVKELIKLKHNVIVIDNLSKGKKELVDKQAKLFIGDLTDKLFVQEIFSNNKFDAVIHFAAYKAVEESMIDAPKYSQNIIGSINILDSMVKFNVPKIIFSSTAATYGMPKTEIVNEETKTEPINYYGFTKLEIENIMKWYNKIHGINFIALRYFNVAGDGGLKYIDPEAKNILPIIMEVITGKRKELTIFGEDYNTPDGTCIRDYIHVLDLVDAHIKALNVKGNHIINLGSNKGFSVKELVNATQDITKKIIPLKSGQRRSGDPAKLIASNDKAKNILGWEPKHDIQEMISSTFNAYTK
ncbi:UDP-glucose 4-epimerase GalE [Candidatus Woesearchaeota archaeon]|nr:UDP-glucose 4-epimerase GalE [Candidatus Woesearchaeota archaeon]